MIDWSLYSEEGIQILTASAIGAIVGLEREFKSKSAGFRTMILICVGSCLFTMLSQTIAGNSDDRIAAQIVTGIGFIGAGVIFKEGISISGLTTAALIWVTAAIGMAIGFQNYGSGIMVAAIVFLVLFVLEPIQNFMRKYIKVKDYRIQVEEVNNDFRTTFEKFLTSNGISFQDKKTAKANHEVIYLYRIKSKDSKYDIVDEFLVSNKDVKTFEV